MHAHPAKTLELRGSVSGADLTGAFHSWNTGQMQRYDEAIGARAESSLRLGDRQFIINQYGNVREVRGLLLQRQRTGDFIDSEQFSAQPQYDKLLGEVELPDGRHGYAVEVTPPGGQSEVVALDTKTFMIDRVSYDDADATSTEDYYDYHVYAGVLVALREVDSNGDHEFDVTNAVEKVVVDRPIDAAIFMLPHSTVVQTDKPVTVQLDEHEGHFYAPVQIHGHRYSFLVDTGAQGIVLDSHVAAAEHLEPRGRLEVSGAQRTGGLGMAPLDAIQIGTATLPVRLASVLNLNGVTGVFQADGILGYPFFAAAEVTIDPVRRTMTFAQPGALRAVGQSVPIDVDRELIELQGRVNNVDGRFIVDTGNATELLLFAPFMQAHPNLIPPEGRHFSNNYGVGGSARAMAAMVDELDLGDYRFFNRHADLMQTAQGAFADRFDAGNIGMGVLRNLVLTFDVANAKMYVDRSSAFDDGRFRARTESMGIP